MNKPIIKEIDKSFKVIAAALNNLGKLLNQESLKQVEA